LLIIFFFLGFNFSFLCSQSSISWFSTVSLKEEPQLLTLRKSSVLRCRQASKFYRILSNQKKKKNTGLRSSMLFITNCENHQPPRIMSTIQCLMARIAVGLRIMADLVAALKSFVKCTPRNRLQRFSTIKAEGSPSSVSSFSSLSSEYSFE